MTRGLTVLLMAGGNEGAATFRALLAAGHRVCHVMREPAQVDEKCPISAICAELQIPSSSSDAPAAALAAGPDVLLSAGYQPAIPATLK